MNRSRALVLAGILVLGAVLVAALIGASQGPLPRYGERQSTGDRSSAPPARPAYRLGQVARLKTYLTTLEVRPVDFVHLPPSGGSGPGVGVRLAIRNVGRSPYRDQPGQAASVLLDGGAEAERLYDPVGGCGATGVDTVTIPPGQTRRFCLPFGPAKRSKLDLFVYAPEAGLPGNRGAPQAASWAF